MTKIEDLKPPEDFAVFILTNGRPDEIKTTIALEKAGYTGRIVLILDNEDETADAYIERFGKDMVYIFDKEKIAMESDEGDNFDGRCAIMYARNATFGIAEELGIKHFIQLDDDYTRFTYRFDAEYQFASSLAVLNMDAALAVMLKYFRSIPAQSIAMSQGGDWMGGKECTLARTIKMRRKVMNSFICSTDRPFKFSGKMNEDVSAYSKLASMGALFLTIPNLMLIQIQTQSLGGGMSGSYADSGTYVKSFYSVMYAPSAVKISYIARPDAIMQGRSRIHHRVQFKNTAPMIVSESLKKVKS